LHFNYAFEPVTFGNMLANGVHSLAVSCHLCTTRRRSRVSQRFSGCFASGISPRLARNFFCPRAGKSSTLGIRRAHVAGCLRRTATPRPRPTSRARCVPPHPLIRGACHGSLRLFGKEKEGPSPAVTRRGGWDQHTGHSDAGNSRGDLGASRQRSINRTKPDQTERPRPHRACGDQGQRREPWRG
jgi:hypothetical protein